MKLLMRTYYDPYIIILHYVYAVESHPGSCTAAPSVTAMVM